MATHCKFNKLKSNCLKLWILLIFIITVLTVLSESYEEELSSSGVFENICQGCRITSFIAEAKKATNLLQCVHSCKRNKNCKSVNYKHLLSFNKRQVESHDHNCELVDATLKSDGKMEFDDRWENYQPINFVSNQYFVEQFWTSMFH